LPPKERGLVQIVTEQPAVLLFGDRFVIRDETNVRTLGGGIVLNPIARRSRKPLAAYRDRLAIIRGSLGAEAVEALLNLQESLALPAGRLACLMNRPLGEIEGVLSDARFIKLSMGDEEGFTTRSKWEELKKFTLAALGAHHQEAPLSAGLEMESLRTRLPYEVSARAFRAIVDRIGREAEIVREESLLRLKSHRVKLGGDAGELGARVEAALSRAEFQPPDLKQLAELLGLASGAAAQLRTVLAAMEREGRVVKIATELYFGRTALDAARSRLVDYLGTHSEISAAIYRDLLGASRKFAIALLDYFDHSGVTTRVGDQRRLRARSG